MKIAICLYGLVGDCYAKYGKFGNEDNPVDYRIGHHFITKNIVEPNRLLNNEIDFFLHSWSVKFRDRFLDSYKPKKHIIEEQIDFYQETPRKNAIKSRWYSTQQCVNLKKSYELENNFTYDLVMLHRFDWMFKVPLVFNDFDPNLFYVSHREDCREENCNCKSSNRFHDSWFFSNSKDMDDFSTLYDALLSKENSDVHTPHEQCVHHIKNVGLWDKVKNTTINIRDHDAIRCHYSNCNYDPSSEFDVSKLVFKPGRQ